MSTHIVCFLKRPCVPVWEWHTSLSFTALRGVWWLLYNECQEATTPLRLRCICKHLSRSHSHIWTVKPRKMFPFVFSMRWVLIFLHLCVHREGCCCWDRRKWDSTHTGSSPTEQKLPELPGGAGGGRDGQRRWDNATGVMLHGEWSGFHGRWALETTSTFTHSHTVGRESHKMCSCESL